MAASSSAGGTTQKRIAFARVFGPVPTYGYTVFTANPDGSGLRQLTPGVSGSSPAWSPNGRSIAFAIGTPLGKHDIAVMSAYGKRIRRIAHNGSYPSWSPDGKRIAFWSLDRLSSKIYVVNADGSGRRLLVASGANPAWSPDGTKILYGRGGNTGHPGLYLMNTDGTGKHLFRKGSFSFAVWSPDGSQIAAFHNSHIWVMNADGIGGRPVAHSFIPSKDADCSFAWSPDGRQLAWTPVPGHGSRTAERHHGQASGTEKHAPRVRCVLGASVTPVDLISQPGERARPAPLGRWPQPNARTAA